MSITINQKWRHALFFSGAAVADSTKSNENMRAGGAGGGGGHMYAVAGRALK